MGYGEDFILGYTILHLFKGSTFMNLFRESKGKSLGLLVRLFIAHLWMTNLSEMVELILTYVMYLGITS